MAVTDDPAARAPLPFHTPPDDAPASLCVLASGSSGNCSVLVIGHGRQRRVCLIDLGLSPRTTRRLLAPLGLTLGDVTDAVVTHLDTDHFRPGWARLLPSRSRLWIHRAHLPRAQQMGVPRTLLRPYTEPFPVGRDALAPGLTVRPHLVDHDDWGVVTLRLALPEADGGAPILGFATDVGRITTPLIDHLAGVPTLAIESNYCPRLQLASSRPAFLKNRIMGGRGHLSNAEAADACRSLEPLDHVVLLHLSRECNTPEAAADPHLGADYALTVSTQVEPTRWVRLRPRAMGRASGRSAPPKIEVQMRQGSLFAHAQADR